MTTLKLITPQTFDCPHCGVVSVGPFMIGGHQVEPNCRNDYCQSQWWMRVTELSFVEQVRENLRAREKKRLEPLKLEALARKLN